MTWWLPIALAFSPGRADVCPKGCRAASIQEAVDAVPAGGTSLITIEAGIWDGPVVISDDRRITLVPHLSFQELQDVVDALTSGDFAAAAEKLEGIEPVTVTHSNSTGQATIVTEGGALTIVGVSVDGDLSRAIDATDTDVTVAAASLFARGFVEEGGLIRQRRGSLLIVGSGLRDGNVGGQGGIVAAYDADVTVQTVSFTGGSGGYGACFFATNSDPENRKTVTLDQATFQDCEGSLRGGAVYLTGSLDAEIVDSSIADSSSGEGGGMALFGPDLKANVQTVLVSDCTAYERGGAIHVEEAELTVLDGSLHGNGAFWGGGMSILGNSTVELQRTDIEGCSALNDGGGIYLASGTLDAIDGSYRNNVATFGEGGGLWVGPEAVWQTDVRSTFCGNVAVSGGAIRSDLGTSTQVSNLRVLDNIADIDGGGIYHSGETLQLSFANLLGNSAGRGSGAAALATGPLTLEATLIAYNLGAVAIVPRPSDSVPVLTTFSVWWDNQRGNLDGLSPNENGSLFVDPLLDSYAPGGACFLAQDWPTVTSPLVDAGPTALRDRDDSISDIGAYGGPLADPDLWSTDLDDDGVPQIYDCDEGDASVFPGAPDTPYDGIDSDCLGNDDFDADNDGYRRIEDGGVDCDDTNEDIYPGAPESPEPGNLVDANCDGLLDADLDGFVRATLPGAEAVGESLKDCDDGDPQVYPGAPELDPDVDYDCDGYIDGPRNLELVGCQAAPTGRAIWWRRR